MGKAAHDAQMYDTTRMISRLDLSLTSARKYASISREIVDFGAALRRYLAIILALLRQEEQSRRAAPMESIVHLLEPVMLAGSFAIFRWFLDEKGTVLGGSQSLFYATGFFADYLFIFLSRRMRGSVDSPGRRFPIEQRLDHIFVHIILSVIDYWVLGVLVFGGIYLSFSPLALPYDFVPVIQACGAIAMLGFGWGILNLVMSRAWSVWPYCFMALSRSLSVFSGSFFIADYLPPNIRYVLSFNPMLHAIALFRTGFYRNQPTLLLDTTYLGYCALFAVLFGLMLERVTRRSEGQ